MTRDVEMNLGSFLLLQTAGRQAQLPLIPRLSLKRCALHLPRAGTGGSEGRARHGRAARWAEKHRAAPRPRPLLPSGLPCLAEAVWHRPPPATRARSPRDPAVAHHGPAVPRRRPGPARRRSGSVRPPTWSFRARRSRDSAAGAVLNLARARLPRGMPGYVVGRRGAGWEL